MAMLQKNDPKPTANDDIETVIGPSVQVEGDFVAAGDVIVEGTVTGSLKTEKSLRVGPNAKIYANVVAASALIAGEIQGNVKVGESLELTSNAKIFGDIRAKILNVASGATIYGKCQVGEQTKTKKDADTKPTPTALKDAKAKKAATKK